jgi:hypothetical protein
MWNMRKRHFSHSCKTAAARMAVKGAPLSSAFIEAKRRPLTATAAEATARERAGTPILCFQHVNAAAAHGYSPGNREQDLFPLAACFQHVYLRKPVNALFFAPAARSPLIPLWFPHSNLKFLYSTRSGVTCHPFSRCAAAEFLGCWLRRGFQGCHGCRTGDRATSDTCTRHAYCEGFMAWLEVGCGQFSCNVTWNSTGCKPFGTIA